MRAAAAAVCSSVQQCGKIENFLSLQKRNRASNAARLNEPYVTSHVLKPKLVNKQYRGRHLFISLYLGIFEVGP